MDSLAGAQMAYFGPLPDAFSIGTQHYRIMDNILYTESKTFYYTQYQLKGIDNTKIRANLFTTVFQTPVFYIFSYANNINNSTELTLNYMSNDNAIKDLKITVQAGDEIEAIYPDIQGQGLGIFTKNSSKPYYAKWYSATKRFNVAANKEYQTWIIQEIKAL